MAKDSSLLGITAVMEHNLRFFMGETPVTARATCYQPRAGMRGFELSADFFIGRQRKAIGSLRLFRVERDFNYRCMELAQDEYLELPEVVRNGVNWWFDGFKRNSDNPRASQYELAPIAQAYLAHMFPAHLGPVDNIFMFPAPYGAHDPKARRKLVAHYAKHFGSKPVPGARYLKVIPGRRVRLGCLPRTVRMPHGPNV